VIPFLVLAIGVDNIFILVRIASVLSAGGMNAARKAVLWPSLLNFVPDASLLSRKRLFFFFLPPLRFCLFLTGQRIWLDSKGFAC